jgi:hypothetical protein
MVRLEEESKQETKTSICKIAGRFSPGTAAIDQLPLIVGAEPIRSNEFQKECRYDLKDAFGFADCRRKSDFSLLESIHRVRRR